MIAFLDTSSLIKLYHKEQNSELILQNLQSVNTIYLSELAKLEFRSAFFRKVRTKDIEEAKAKAVISLFERDSVKFEWINIDSMLIDKAKDLLFKYGKKGLRTLDSIQFASALILQENDCLCFTEDKLLQELFKDANLKTY